MQKERDPHVTLFSTLKSACHNLFSTLKWMIFQTWFTAPPATCNVTVKFLGFFGTWKLDRLPPLNTCCFATCSFLAEFIGFIGLRGRVFHLGDFEKHRGRAGSPALQLTDSTPSPTRSSRAGAQPQPLCLGVLFAFLNFLDK